MGYCKRTFGHQMHAATQIHSRPQGENEMLQEYIQRFTDLVIQATGTDPTTMICQVTLALFIRHPFNKEIKKHFSGTKMIWPLRYVMTLAQEAEIKLTKYKGLSSDDPSVIQISSIL